MAEKLGEEVASYAVENIQDMLALDNAGHLVATKTARLKEYGREGMLFLLTNFIVFTDVFNMSSPTWSVQARAILPLLLPVCVCMGRTFTSPSASSTAKHGNWPICTAMGGTCC
mmetsp:Transcript_46058/g.115322  ORF Transcript_46058/g.115322 Transcript_46058/m.115322 type:complete len:114 (+) Transcript_46058:2342-2683(+)